MEILTLLARNAASVGTFGQILAGLGRADSPAARQALRNSIDRLRRKIECDPRRPDLLLTEVGVGYQLAGEPGDPLYTAAPPNPNQGKDGRAT